MITKNEIYTYIRSKILEYDANVFCTSDRIYASSRFPTMEIKLISATPIRENVDLSDTSYRFSYEVTAYSDKSQGGAEEAYNLVRVAEEAFREIGFRMTYDAPSENIKEITVKRHIARFTRMVCSGDTIQQGE